MKKVLSQLLVLFLVAGLATSQTKNTPIPEGKTVTDGSNARSPLKFLKSDYSNDGAKNSIIYMSATVQNTSKTVELKDVHIRLNVLDGNNVTLMVYESPAYTLKPGASQEYSPGRAVNHLGVTLHLKPSAYHDPVTP